MSNKKRPTVLVYRRTHTGDPDENGVFGCSGCMGSVRGWKYDAVIGIGGKKPWANDKVISGRVNWIGTGRTYDPIGSKMPLVTFSKFILWDEKGPKLSDVAPKLDKYMFEHGRIPRTAKSFPDEIYEEILQILKLAKNAPPSKGGSEKIKKKKSCKSLHLPKHRSRGCS